MASHVPVQDPQADKIASPANILLYLSKNEYPRGFTKDNKHNLRAVAKKSYRLEGEALMHKTHPTRNRDEYPAWVPVLLDRDDQLRLLKEAHGGTTDGPHRGLSSSMNYIARRAWWPSFTNDVKSYECAACCARKGQDEAPLSAPPACDSKNRPRQFSRKELEECLTLPPSEVIVRTSNYSITSAILLKLKNLEPLDDNIINAYLHLVQEKHQQECFLPTSLMVKIKHEGVQAASRSTAKINLFQFEKLFFPIHGVLFPNSTLAVVDLKRHTLTYYDRPQNRILKYGEEHMHDIEKFLKVEHTKRGFGNDFGPLTHAFFDVPCQGDTYDSGLYVCFLARRIAGGDPFSLSPNEVKNLRSQIPFELLAGKLLRSCRFL